MFTTSRTQLEQVVSNGTNCIVRANSAQMAFGYTNRKECALGCHLLFQTPPLMVFSRRAVRRKASGPKK